MKLLLEVDYNSGGVLPDGKVSEWARKKLEEAVSSEELIVQNVGSDLMVTAMCHWVKKMKVGAGVVGLHYVGGLHHTVELEDSIDADGKLGYVGKGGDVLSELLIELF